MDLSDLYFNCGYPEPTSTDVEAWNSLENGDTATVDLQFGLFGYDITCLAHFCAINRDNIADDGYCGLVEARGLDGLAFGIYASVPTASSGYYCVGFRSEPYESFACAYNGSDVYTYFVYGHYSVGSDYFTNNQSYDFAYRFDYPYYGLSKLIFATCRGNDFSL